MVIRLLNLSIPRTEVEVVLEAGDSLFHTSTHPSCDIALHTTSPIRRCGLLLDLLRTMSGREHIRGVLRQSAQCMVFES